MDGKLMGRTVRWKGTWRVGKGHRARAVTKQPWTVQYSTYIQKRGQ